MLQGSPRLAPGACVCGVADHALTFVLQAVDALGEMWWREGCGNWWCPPGYPHNQPKAFRPFLFRIDASEGVTVTNITMRNPGFWNLVPVHSKGADPAATNADRVLTVC